MLNRVFSILLLLSSFLIVASCHKENQKKNPEISNKPFFLRGMQVTWNERTKIQGSQILASSPEQTWFTLADVRRMKNAGATCIEIHQMGLPDLMPARNVPNESFFVNWVDIWVDWCTQNQMYCILDIASLGAWADWFFYLNMPPWLWEGLYPTPSRSDTAKYDSIIRDFYDVDIAIQDTNRIAFINLWKFIANRYKNNPYVMFSIMNEPFWNVHIPDEATSIHLGQSYSTFMEQVIDGIRSTGATQRVFINLPFLWDQKGRNTVKPVNRDSIVWEVHVYGNMWDPKLEPFKASINYYVQLFMKDFNKPLFIGEYGFGLISDIRINSGNDWKSILSSEVLYLDSLSPLGRQFHSWDYMNGEYSLFSGESDLTSAESEWIIKTVLSDK